MPGQNNEFDILTINGYPFNTKDTTARNDIASIIGAIQVNNTSISGRINDLNERAFEDLIKISSNNETEISDIDDGMYKIQYVTVETIEEEEIETINNTALLIQKGTNQYLFKDGQLSSRTKTNNTWGNWITSASGVSSVNGQTGAVTVSTLPTVTSTDNGKILIVVNGQWTLVSPSTLYSGSGAPNNANGNNGDIYIQTS